MGWGRTLFLGDIGNRLDIADAEREIASIKHELTRLYREGMTTEEQLERLIQDNAELRLYLASLFRVLMSKSIISKEEVEQMVQNVDGSDGAVDGQHDGPII